MYLLHKTKHLHLFFIFLLALHYIIPLLFIGQVTVYPHDNLDSGVVLDHIISNIYKGNFESINYLLGGQIKWHYLEELFWPINILHYFLSDKIFYFSDDILKKLFAYFSFYLLAKSIGNTKFNSALGAVLFTTIINIKMPHGLGLPLLPYILYLLINKDSLNIKHYIFLFLIGLNTSLIQDFFTYILLIPLAFILTSKKNLNIYIRVLSTVIFASVIANIHLVIGSIISVPIHRSAMTTARDEITPLLEVIRTFFFYGDPAVSTFIFNIPLVIFTSFIVFFSAFSKEKNIKLIFFFIIGILILKALALPSIINNFFIGILEIFKGFNFQRLDRINALSFSLLFILLSASLKYNNLRKFLYLLSFISIISMQLKTPLPIIGQVFLKENMSIEIFDKTKKLFLEKKYTQFYKIITNKNSYSNNKLGSNSSSDKTFDNYYKFSDYAFIKNIVKDARVMSVGLDPMIAVMNDIKVIDGYHNIYPLDYKIKFRKIIEKELENNEMLKNYYDTWGNRVYAFYNNQNDIVLNFKAAKEIGADFIISKFPIENNELEMTCLKCNGSDEIFLYKIL